MPDNNASLFLTDLLKGGTQVTGAIEQANALQQQNKFEQSVFDFNSAMATSKAQEAIQAGEEAASLQQRQSSEVIGREAAASAGSGTVANAGTNLAAQEQTGEIGAHNALMVRMNAEREALAYNVQATEGNIQGILEDTATQSKERNTIWSGLEGGLGDVSEGFKNLFPVPKLPASADGNQSVVNWDSIPPISMPYGVSLNGQPRPEFSLSS